MELAPSEKGFLLHEEIEHPLMPSSVSSKTYCLDIHSITLGPLNIFSSANNFCRLTVSQTHFVSSFCLADNVLGRLFFGLTLASFNLKVRIHNPSFKKRFAFPHCFNLMIGLLLPMYFLQTHPSSGHMKKLLGSTLATQFFSFLHIGAVAAAMLPVLCLAISRRKVGLDSP